MVPKAAQPCYNGGWQTLIRSDGSTFASQQDCVNYAWIATNVLVPSAAEPCLDPGWVLRNKTTAAAVTAGTQECRDLAAAGKLTGMKTTKTVNTSPWSVTWSVSAFGVAATPAGPYTVPPFPCPYKGTAFESTTSVLLPDPWAGGGGGGSCGSPAPFIGQQVGADGLFVRSGTTPCPTPLTSVDQVGGLLSWSKFFEVAGSTTWTTDAQWIQAAVDSSGCPDATPANVAPDAKNDAYSVVVGQTLNAATVFGNDSDADSVFRLKEFTQPSEGALNLIGDGTFTYVAPADPSSATVTFEYTIEDRGGLTDTATVTITINQPT